MIFGDLARRISKLAADNSPAILSAIGVTGTLTTAFLVGKASFEAAEIIREVENREVVSDDSWELLKQRTKLTWKLYIPAAGSSVMTVACIVAANRVGTRRAAAMAAAYKFVSSNFEEYKDKVVDKIGDKKERDLRDEISQDQIDRIPYDGSEIPGIGQKPSLCFDVLNGRYFYSTMEDIRRAENVINHRVTHNNYACVADFYDELDLPRTGFGDDFGWNLDNLLEVITTPCLSSTNEPAISMSFKLEPIRDYTRVY